MKKICFVYHSFFLFFSLEKCAIYNAITWSFSLFARKIYLTLGISCFTLCSYGKKGKKNEKQNDSESQTRSSVTPALPSPVISRPGADGHSSTHYPVGVEEVGKCTRKQIRVSLRFLVCQGTEKASS